MADARLGHIPSRIPARLIYGPWQKRIYFKLAGDDDRAASDPFWDDICETLLSLAKAPPRSMGRRAAVRSGEGQPAEWKPSPNPLWNSKPPPPLGTIRARILAAFEPGAWMALPDIRRRSGLTKQQLEPKVYQRLWPIGWLERTENPDWDGSYGVRLPGWGGFGPKEPRYLWRLTDEGVEARARSLAGESEWIGARMREAWAKGAGGHPRAKEKPRRSGAIEPENQERRERRLSRRRERAG